MSVLAIVISYNNGAATRQCIEALDVQTIRPEIVVWDNASPDNVRPFLEGFEGRGQIVYSETNNLWTPACNKAARQFMTTGHQPGHDAVMFMNNDIILAPNAVEAMVADLRGAGAVAPWGARLGGMQDQAVWSQRVPGTEALRTSYVVGACMMISRGAWEHVGEFDERMPLGGDDHDYCIRLKHDGYPIKVCRSTFADHLGHASSQTPGGPEAWSEWGGKSWEAFNTKWAGYYATEEEAVKGHWSSEWHSDFPRGTGWDEETYNERVRKENY